MPWGVAAAVAGAATSAALAPSPSGGSSGGSQSYYVPTGLSAADQQWQNLQSGNINAYNQALPQISALGNQALQGQMAAYGAYEPAYTQAANLAGQRYGALGSQLTGAAGTEFGAANQIYQTAFDPQSALYNRTVQQLQDQTGATNSMYGLGSSGVGAGVANQALSNFNIDWQNQQLQRQLQGLGGIGQAYGQAGALGQAGAGATLQGGQLPFQAAQQITGTPGQIGTTYGQYQQGNIYGPAQGFQSQAIPYMNYGQGAQSVPYQNAYDTSQANAGALSQGIRGLGSNPQVQAGIGNLFGSGTTGSFGGGDFSGAFSSNPYYSGGGNSYGFTM